MTLLSTLTEVPSTLLSSKFILAALSILAVPVFLLVARLSDKPSRRHTAIVLVLGDVGRSPRMMYHAQSLSQNGWETSLIGYGDTPPIPALLNSPSVRLLHLANPPASLLRLPWSLRAGMRILWQVVSVLNLCLWEVAYRPEVVLVQNPPSIPTLLLAQVVAYWTGAKLVIDWHNTGYSILAMRVGTGSLLVRVAEWWVRSLGLGLMEGSSRRLGERRMRIFSSRGHWRSFWSASGI